MYWLYILCGWAKTQQCTWYGMLIKPKTAVISKQSSKCIRLSQQQKNTLPSLYPSANSAHSSGSVLPVWMMVCWLSLESNDKLIFVGSKVYGKKGQCDREGHRSWLSVLWKRLVVYIFFFHVWQEDAASLSGVIQKTNLLCSLVTWLTDQSLHEVCMRSAWERWWWGIFSTDFTLTPKPHPLPDYLTFW